MPKKGQKWVYFGHFLGKNRKKTVKNQRARKKRYTHMKLSTTTRPNLQQTTDFPVRRHEANERHFCKKVPFLERKWLNFVNLAPEIGLKRPENGQKLENFMENQCKRLYSLLWKSIHLSNVGNNKSSIFSSFCRNWGFEHVLPPSGSLCGPPMGRGSP